MCILFLATTGDYAEQSDNKYKLILAANRDEYYKRPAKVAQFWENTDVIGGRDMEPGREGGTWLAMSKNGRIGILLNILDPKPDPNKLGRGFLVNNFVNSSNVDALNYAEKLSKEGNLYNDFNLVTLNVKEAEPYVTYVNAGTGNILSFKHTNQMVSAFGNSLYETPFLKVADGKEKVQELIQKYPNKTQKDDLINGLLDILKNNHRFHPDPQMQKQIDDITYLQGMSSRFVEMEQLNYGSRTHTIILVDYKNEVEFNEWTMEEPINSNNIKWVHNKFIFSLN